MFGRRLTPRRALVAAENDPDVLEAMFPSEVLAELYAAFAKDELPALQVVTRNEDGSVQLSSELPPVGAEAQALALAQMIETVGEDDKKHLKDVRGTTNIELDGSTAGVVAARSGA